MIHRREGFFMSEVRHLFQDISKEDYRKMMVCFHSVEKQYDHGELVCTYGTSSEQIGIVLEGTVQLLRTHLDGRQTILEQLGPGDIFSETLSFVSENSSTVQVICTSRSRIQFIDYGHLIKRCPKACPFHSRLVNNALQMISQKAVHLSERLEVLSQRSTREKLQCYFGLLAEQKHSRTFLLPFSYSALADYLSVDRSAMMREIKRMKNEGLIRTDRHEITIC